MSSADITPADAEQPSAHDGESQAFRRHTLVAKTALVTAIAQVLLLISLRWPRLFYGNVTSGPPTLQSWIVSVIYVAGGLSLAACMALIFRYDHTLSISPLMRRAARAAAILLVMENFTAGWYTLRGLYFSLSSFGPWEREHPLRAALGLLFPHLPAIVTFAMIAFLIAVGFARAQSPGAAQSHSALRASASIVVLAGVVLLAEYGYAFAANFRFVLGSLYTIVLRLASLGALLSFFVALRRANREKAILQEGG